jgi:hypothetical protein
VKGGLLAAWVTAEALLIWRIVHRDHAMPVPGELVAVTGLFAALAAVADVFPASAGLITVTAWGLDVAGFLNLWPAGLGGQVQQAAAAGTGAGRGEARGTAGPLAPAAQQGG